MTELEVRVPAPGPLTPGTRGPAGPLQELLLRPGVTDVLVNGPDDVWVEQHGSLRRVDVDLGTLADVRALGVRLAAACGQRLDDAAPWVDGRLPDGTRLHAVLPPLAHPSTLISLRVSRSRPRSLDELVARGSVAPPVAALVRALVARRANVLVSGATGTGKTTLLAAALGLVPPDERIVLLEETHELEPDHPHVVRLVTRRPNVDGAGEVDLAQLVRQAMRMRPDRLVVGEARGPETRDVLAALNTGHDGGWATVHAGAAADVPARLEALGVLAGLPPAALAVQAASAVDAVVHLVREPVRRVAEVAVLERRGDGLVVDGAVRVDADGTVTAGPAWDRLAHRIRLGERAP